MNYISYDDFRDCKVYCGTYAKYNEGSIEGDWLTLSDYSDKDEFLDACAELHKDETDPEFMFQDWEYIPKGLISESYIDEEIWELLDLNESDFEMLSAYCTLEYDELRVCNLRDAESHCVGKYDDDEDCARAYIAESCYSDIPTIIENNIDWKGVYNDLGYESENHYYFWTN